MDLRNSDYKGNPISKDKSYWDKEYTKKDSKGRIIYYAVKGDKTYVTTSKKEIDLICKNEINNKNYPKNEDDYEKYFGTGKYK